MIRTQDLMLGNWVYDGEHTKFPMYVVGMGEDYAFLDFPGNEGDVWESTPEELQGIPITEDLLKKMGFTLSNGLWRKRENGRAIAIKVESTFVSIEAFEDKLLDSRCTCHGIKYLHQLQNLFWSIAKEQLKVNL